MRWRMVFGQIMINKVSVAFVDHCVFMQGGAHALNQGATDLAFCSFFIQDTPCRKHAQQTAHTYFTRINVDSGFSKMRALGLL